MQNPLRLRGVRLFACLRRVAASGVYGATKSNDLSIGSRIPGASTSYDNPIEAFTAFVYFATDAGLDFFKRSRQRSLGRRVRTNCFLTFAHEEFFFLQNTVAGKVVVFFHNAAPLRRFVLWCSESSLVCLLSL
jgi:hypothetical protein